MAVALDAGFDCVSVDLIFGFPREARDCQDAVPASLRTVMELSPQHVSCYQLTVHGERYMKDTYEVTKGTKPRPVEDDE